MTYPTFSMDERERNLGRWVDVSFGRVEGELDEEIGDEPGRVLVSVDPITNTISFAMEDREFSVDRQQLADTINQLWPQEVRRIEEFTDKVFQGMTEEERVEAEARLAAARTVRPTPCA